MAALIRRQIERFKGASARIRRRYRIAAARALGLTIGLSLGTLITLFHLY